MLLVEKDSPKQEDNSTSSNSENDFKELDLEIDKVIRGETSLEEETIEDMTEDSSLIQKNERNKIPKKNHKQISIKSDKDLNKINILKYINQNEKEKISALDQYKTNLIISLLNSDQTQYNKINLQNNIKNSVNINKSFNQNIDGYINNKSYNNFPSSSNKSYYQNNNYNNKLSQNPIIHNINQNNNINDINQNTNSYLNELISLYNQNFNGFIDNNKNLNYSNISPSCINNNVNNINVNNISLLQILNNQLLNEYKQQKIKENILMNNSNSNISPKLYSNFNNNYVNNINNLKDPLLNNNFRMPLLINNINNNDEINQYLLLNQIKNKNLLNINKNNENKNLNLFNNQSQIDFNFVNVNNININNNIIKNNEQMINNNNNLFSFNPNFINIIPNTQQQSPNNIKIKNNNINSIDSNNNTHKKKNNQKSNLDINKNIINLMNILLCEDKRTTLMIKNIPNKYTISSFLEEINTYFKFTYDIFYLPIDYVNKCNLGFAFINFVEPFHIILFYELYRGKKWKKFNSDKICELLYAKFQGKEELIAHFEKGKVLSFESEEKRPLILPTPNPLPKINLPYYYFDLFIKIYPNISYEIKDCKNIKKNNNGKNNYYPPMFPFFSINGNFHKY